MDMQYMDSKVSLQQELIYQILEGKGWLSTKEITAQVIKINPAINYRGILRSLNRLVERGLLNRIEVFDRENLVSLNKARWAILWRRVDGSL